MHAYNRQQKTMNKVEYLDMSKFYGLIGWRSTEAGQLLSVVQAADEEGAATFRRMLNGIDCIAMLIVDNYRQISDE